ncbi:MAG: hypothetical protein RL173_2933 [Fibrobacterota bacterium]|jgi:hypothetical protein
MVSTLLLLALGSFGSDIVSVSGGSGSAQRLQSAVDACPNSGCVIELPDSLYPLSDRIWIEGKNELKLVGTGPTKPVLIWEDSLLAADTAKIAAVFRLPPGTGIGRPRLPKNWLMWPYAYKSGVGTASDSSVTFSTTGYQHNGLILIKKSSRISMENLIIDGRKPAAFVNRDVWDGLYDLYFGSVGISLLQSLAVDVRTCEIRNFWAGLYLNNRNPSCQAWQNTIGRSDTGAKPWKACGTMGGHLIERNRIHANWWAVYSEAEWDQGSIIRENLAWDNANQLVLNPGNTVSPLSDMTREHFDFGGFLYSKDDLMPVHTVTHNTIYNNALTYGFDYYRITGTAFWSDNIIHYVDSLKKHKVSNTTFEALDDYTASGNHLWNTTIVSYIKGSRTVVSTAIVRDTSIHYLKPLLVPRDTVVELIGGKLVDVISYDTVPTLVDCGTGCYVNLNPPDTLPYYYTNPWNLNQMSQGRFLAQVKGPDSLPHEMWITSPHAGNNTVLLGHDGQDTILSKDHSNWLCRFCNFNSLDPESSAFLVLDTNSEEVKTTTLRLDTTGGHRGAIGASGRLGAHVPIRLRARGMPRYDLSRSLLHLPVAIASETTAKLDAMVVRKIRIFHRSEDSLGRLFPVESELKVSPSSLQPFQVTDTVISIPLQVGFDRIYQIELWTVGVSGSDTLAATPMSWAWTMKASSGTFHIPASIPNGKSASSTPVILRQMAGRLRLTGYFGPTLKLIDATGAAKTLSTQSEQNGRSISIRDLHSGIWFANLPTGTRSILISP